MGDCGFDRGKIGWVPQTLHEWVKKAEVDSGKAGVPTDVAEKLKALERENRELRVENTVRSDASACPKSKIGSLPATPPRTAVESGHHPLLNGFNSP